MTLWQAARRRNPAELVRLLEDGADVNGCDEQGQTALMVASAAGRVETVQLLLGAGAEIDLQDESSLTALMHAAAGYGGRRHRERVVRTLLKAGARVDLENHLVLSCAASGGTPGMVRDLIAKGADVNRSGEDGKTPLMEAAETGRVEMAEVLLDAGADATRKLPDGTNAASLAVWAEKPVLVERLLAAGAPRERTLLAAACSGSVDLVGRLLAEGASPNEEDQYGYTPLSIACSKGKADVVRCLIEAGASVDVQDHMGLSPLMDACTWGRAEIVEILLQAGANLELVDTCRETALHKAAWRGKPECVRLTLDAGANPNVCDRYATPLMDASVQGYQDSVAMLLAAGADPNAKLPKFRRHGLCAGFRKGATALMMAARQGNLSIVEALLAAGADPKARDSGRRTALDFAADAGHVEIAERLREAGARRRGIDVRLHQAALLKAAAAGDEHGVEKLLRAGAGTEYAGERGYTALLLAAQNGSEAICRRLLEAGADANYRSQRDLTPLRVAVARNHTDIVRLLLDNGASVNQRYQNASVPAGRANSVISSGEHVLIDAAVYGLSEIADALLSAGADVNVCDSRGGTPLLYAAWNHHYELARSLLAAGAVARAEDAPFLEPMRFFEAAQTPEFQQSIEQLESLCGKPGEKVNGIPGAMAFPVLAGEETKELMRSGEIASDWVAGTIARQQKSRSLVEQAWEHCHRRGHTAFTVGNERVLLIPTDDKFAIMAVFGVNANEQQKDTREIIHWFRQLDQEHPFQLRGCRFDAVEIEFDRLVEDPAKMAQRMYDFCHDLVGQGFETLDKLADHLKADRRVWFWWD